MRFLSMIGFMKIVRVAKMVETAQNINESDKLNSTVFKGAGKVRSNKSYKIPIEVPERKKSAKLSIKHKKSTLQINTDDSELDSYEPTVSDCSDDCSIDVDPSSKMKMLMERKSCFADEGHFINQHRTKGESHKKDSLLITRQKIDKVQEKRAKLESRKTKTEDYFDGIEFHYELHDEQKEREELLAKARKVRDGNNFYSWIKKRETKRNPRADMKKQMRMNASSRLEKRMTSNVLKNTIGVCMSILILFPITSESFIKDTFYEDSSILEFDEFCSKNMGNELNNFIEKKQFNEVIFDTFAMNCLNPSIEIDQVKANNLFYIDFSDCAQTIKEIQERWPKTQMIYEISGRKETAENDWRINQDYFITRYKVAERCEFIYYVENRDQNQWFSMFFLSQSIIVSFLLLSVLYMIINSHMKFIITPLDKLFGQFFTYFNNINSLENSVQVTFLNHEQELGLIDTYTQFILNFISITIGKEILYLIPFTNLTGEMEIDFKQPGVRSEVYVVHMRIVNLEQIIKHSGVSTMSVINRLYCLFHKLGLVLNGEPVNRCDMIMWRENNNEYSKEVKKYLTALVEDIDNAETVNQEETPNKDPLACCLFFCLRFMYNLHAYHKSFLLELESYGVYVNLYVNKFTVFSGYLGSKEKLQDILISPGIKRTLYFAVSF